MTSIRAAAAAALFAAAAGCGDAGDGTVTLRLWAMGREGEVVQELVRDFERDHPGIEVRVQQIPWTAAHEKLLTAHVGGVSPDIAQLGNTWVPEFEALGALEPLDTLVARSDAVDPADYFPGIWDTNVLHDTLFGVPWYVDTRLIFYRSDLLRRAGYDSMPASWAEWSAALAALDELMGEGQYPIYLPTNEWNQPAIFGMQAGATLLDADATRGAFSDPAFRRAFDFYLGIYRRGWAPVAGLYDIANPYQEFARGTFAMWITGPWNIGEFRRRLPPELQDDWATAPLPGPTGAESGISMAGGSSLVVFRGSEHTAEAWALVEFLSRPEQQLRFYHLTGDLPARESAWADSALAADRHVRAFYDQLQRVQPLPKAPEWELIATRIIDHAETAIRGGVPAERALANLDRDVDRMLEKRRWMLARRDRE